MRWIVAFAVLSIAAAFATMQVVASVALRDAAPRGAWVRALPAGAPARILALADALPLPATFRLVLARRALAARDVTGATSEAARIGPVADRYAMDAAIARARGDGRAAARDDLVAGDLGGIDRDLDALLGAGAYDAAGALAREAVARVAREGREPDVQAAAWFRLGDVEEQESWRLAVGAPARVADERAAYDADRRAVALAPLVARYLLGTANQALNVGAYDDAERLFLRAAALAPDSADPIAGLGDLARRRGSLARARADLAHARTLDPRSAAVIRLEHDLGP